MKDSTKQIIDIVIFGICIFAVLLLFEYQPEIGRKTSLLASVPIGLIGLFFGFRSANGYKNNTPDSND